MPTPQKFELTADDLKKIQDALVQVGKSAIKQYLEYAKEEGKAVLIRAKKFADAAQGLTIEVIRGKITKEGYDDSMHDLRLALENYLIAEGYRKAREHLKFLVNILKSAAMAALNVLMAIV